MDFLNASSLSVFAVAALLGGCSHVTNAPLCSARTARCEFDGDAKTTYRFSPRGDKETLIIVTLSGGGTRAAALAYGTLKTLEMLPPVKQKIDDHAIDLLDQVD